MRKFLANDEFVEIWQTSQNVDEVMTRTGTFYKSVVERAHKLRKKGFDLKKFPKLTKGGAVPGDGIMIWLKSNYPQVYDEWKAWTHPEG